MIGKEFFEYKTFVKKRVRKPDIMKYNKTKADVNLSKKRVNIFTDSPVKNNVKIFSPSADNNKTALA